MTTKPTMLRFLGTILLVSLALAGCKRTRTASAASNPSVATSAGQTVAPKPDAPKVRRIVFVGKEHACDCTRKTVEGAWAVLEKALGAPAKLPIERLQIDTQADKVAPYKQQKPIMALPAIYFLDGKGAVVGFLQGEVTEDQVQAALR